MSERSVIVGLGMEERLSKKGQGGRLGGAGNRHLDCSGLSLLKYFKVNYRHDIPPLNTAVPISKK